MGVVCAKLSALPLIAAYICARYIYIERVSLPIAWGKMRSNIAKREQIRVSNFGSKCQLSIAVNELMEI